MWYVISEIIFILFTFSFIYKAGTLNKGMDRALENELGDVIEQGRSQRRKNQNAFGFIVYPIIFWKKLIKKHYGHN